MITVTLNKDDLINLLKGVAPDYKQISQYVEEGLGDFTGGHCDMWQWNTSELQNKSDELLFQIYLHCIL